MANVCRMAFRWKVEDHADQITTCHFLKSSTLAAFTGPEMNTLAQVLTEWWTNPFEDFVPVRKAFSIRTSLSGVAYNRVQPTPTEQVEIPFGLPGDFPTGEDVLVPGPPPHFEHIDYSFRPLPPQNSLLISLHTDDESRSGRGRMYLPAPPAQYIDDDGRFLTKIEAYGTGNPVDWGRKLYLQTADSLGPTPDVRLCVYSRLRGEARRVRAISCPDKVVTQRRRELEIVTRFRQDV